MSTLTPKLDADVQAFLDGWGARWTGPEPASVLFYEATQLLVRARLYAPHHVPMLEYRWHEAYKAMTTGLG